MATEVVLQATGPISLPAVVTSHGWVQLAPFEERDDGGYATVARLDSRRVLHYETSPLENGFQMLVDEALSEEEAFAEWGEWKGVVYWFWAWGVS